MIVLYFKTNNIMDRGNVHRAQTMNNTKRGGRGIEREKETEIRAQAGEREGRGVRGGERGREWED